MSPTAETGPRPTLRLFVCGDVMIGRGIDQVLPHSVDPRLHEAFVRDARDYVRLAEQTSGPIPRPVDPAWPWGDALEAIDRFGPHVRIVNLETALTTSDEAMLGKEVLYRSHPANVSVLVAARVDCASLANNHVLDWGAAGLGETLDALHSAGVTAVGAGLDLAEAEAPAVFEAGGGRVIVVGLGSTTSGIPSDWAAGAGRPGVALLAGLPLSAVETVARRLGAIRRPGDVVIASIHWGSNWGYDVPAEQRRFARALVDAGVDVVHGHSSHHPRGVEIHRDRPILHGCGDFITDYEGIRGYEQYRNDLVVGYGLELDRATGRLESLTLLPFRVRRFRLERAAPPDVAWLRGTLDRASRPLGTRVIDAEDGALGIRAEGR